MSSVHPVTVPSAMARMFSLNVSLVHTPPEKATPSVLALSTPSTFMLSAVGLLPLVKRVS